MTVQQPDIQWYIARDGKLVASVAQECLMRVRER